MPPLSGGHLFGTDSLGRDLFTRTLHGGRMSLLIGLVSTLVSLVIGIAWGATAGFLGGRIDRVMMRIVDILYALPFMFLVILLMVLFGRNILLIFVAIGAINWLDMARIVRGQTLGLKQREFIEAARVSGVRTGRIILRHIVPNLLGVVVVYVTLTIPAGDPRRILPELPGPRRAGADDLLGRDGERRRARDGKRALDAGVPGAVPGHHAVLLQLPR